MEDSIGKVPHECTCHEQIRIYLNNLHWTMSSLSSLILKTLQSG